MSNHKEYDASSWNYHGYTLSPFPQEAAEKYFQDCFTEKDEEVNRLTGSKNHYEHDQIIAYYQKIIHDPNRYDFILMDPSGTFIGESVINEIDWESKSANFRIVLFDSKNCNKGIGTWMVKTTRDFAFETLHLHRLELDVFSFNPRARYVYEKAGFQVEGIRRDAILDGEAYADDIIMAILETDWKQQKQKESNS